MKARKTLRPRVQINPSLLTIEDGLRLAETIAESHSDVCLNICRHRINPEAVKALLMDDGVREWLQSHAIIWTSMQPEDAKELAGLRQAFFGGPVK